MPKSWLNRQTGEKSDKAVRKFAALEYYRVQNAIKLFVLRENKLADTTHSSCSLSRLLSIRCQFLVRLLILHAHYMRRYGLGLSRRQKQEKNDIIFQIHHFYFVSPVASLIYAFERGILLRSFIRVHFPLFSFSSYLGVFFSSLYSYKVISAITPNLIYIFHVWSTNTLGVIDKEHTVLHH